MTRNFLAGVAGVLSAYAIVLGTPLQAAEHPSRPAAKTTADYINSVPSRRKQASAVKPVAQAVTVSHEVIYQDEGMPLEGDVMIEGGGHETWLDAGAAGMGCGGCGSCSSCGPCGNGFQFGPPCGQMVSWDGQIDYLLWWRKGSPLPPLVTTGGTDGVLGTGAVTLFGDETAEYDTQSGGRVSLGLWLDDCRRWNLSGRYWQLGESSINFSASGDGSAGSTLIARPFFNADPGVGADDSELVNEPGVRSGSISIQSTSDVLGGDLMLRHLLNTCGDSRLEFVTGYQFSRFDESLAFDSTSTITATNLTRNVRETFDTRNEFHGALLGLRAEYHGGGWTLDILGKVGLGSVDQTVSIAGATQNVDAVGGVTNVAGGLLAQTSNIGVFNQSEFAMVPELNVNLAYQIGCHTKVGLGYSIIYWSEAVQPGNQIDTTVDPTQASGLPMLDFESRDFWVQGLNFGLQWDY